MPVKSIKTSRRKMSSVMVSTKVQESTMTSIKTVSYERNSCGQLVETWSSPGLALTSPQTWVSGPQAKFLSPPKSASPKRRVTRRSSVYMKPLWSGKSPVKLSPSNVEFKVPVLSTGSSSTRTRRSSVYQKTGQEPAVSRRSSVYTRRSKAAPVNSTLVEVEESMSISSSDKKLKQASPKGKPPSLSSLSRNSSKSSPSVTHSRKRNVAEMEKAESPVKPAAKRRRRQPDKESVETSPQKGGSAHSAPQGVRKQAKKSRLPEKKATKTPSPRKTRTAKAVSSKDTPKQKRTLTASEKNETKAKTSPIKSKSKRQSLEPPLSSPKKILSKDVDVSAESVQNSAGLKLETPSSKRKSQTVELKLSSDTPKSKTKASGPSRKSGQQGLTTTKQLTAEENVNMKTEENVSTPKSPKLKKRKSRAEAKSAQKSLPAKSVEKSSKKTTRAKHASHDALDGSYLQVSNQQTDMISPVSKKSSPAKLSARSLEDEKILEILRKAVHSTPQTPLKSAKSTKKSATPKRLQGAQISATPKSQKKRSVSAKHDRLSQSSSTTKVTSSRKTPKITMTDTLSPISTKQGVTRRRVTPSREFLDQSDGEPQLTGPNFNLNSADRHPKTPSLKSASSLQDQVYREEKTLSQFVERRTGAGVERYGSQAVEQTVGDQTYRAGSYLIQQEKALLMEKEEIEGRWEEGNVNNSALSLSDDANISTSSYSNRCSIL